MQCSHASDRHRTTGTDEASPTLETVLRSLNVLRATKRGVVRTVHGVRASWVSVPVPGRTFNPLIRLEGLGPEGGPLIAPIDEASVRLHAHLTNVAHPVSSVPPTRKRDVRRRPPIISDVPEPFGDGETRFYEDIRTRVLKAHCASGRDGHDCLGRVTLDRNSVTLNCPLCGDARKNHATVDRHVDDSSTYPGA